MPRRSRRRPQVSQSDWARLCRYHHLFTPLDKWPDGLAVQNNHWTTRPKNFAAVPRMSRFLSRIFRRTSHHRSRGSQGDCFWASFPACQAPGGTSSTSPSVPPTSCFIEEYPNRLFDRGRSRHQIRQKLIHGHYFGMTEEQPKRGVAATPVSRNRVKRDPVYGYVRGLGYIVPQNGEAPLSRFPGRRSCAMHHATAQMETVPPQQQSCARSPYRGE